MLRWFGHIERMESEEFVKKVYVSEALCPNSGGRTHRRWNDRARVQQKYMCERAFMFPEGEAIHYNYPSRKY